MGGGSGGGGGGGGECEVHRLANRTCRGSTAVGLAGLCARRQCRSCRARRES